MAHRGAYEHDTDKTHCEIPEHDMVIIQPAYIQRVFRQLTALRLPVQRPIAIVEPTMHCVVKAGRARRVAIMTVIAEPGSIKKLRDGECNVR
jgi:hypothetical protein